jgi:tripartite-type tricarboxylate transporter receptor subunit TctC
MRHRRLLCLLLCLAAFAGSAAAAAPQDYPARPIRIVVGPGPDALARLVGQKLTEAWGQQMIVDQRPAAGGIVAADVVAKAAPDGYTLLLSTGSFTINTALNAKLPYDFLRDLTPVSLMATIPFILVVRADSPIHSLKQLIDTARTQPDKLNYASAGNGTPPHLAGEMLKQMAGIAMVHVPYKGVGPAITDLLGGQVLRTAAGPGRQTAGAGRQQPAALRAAARGAHGSRAGLPGVRCSRLERPARPRPHAAGHHRKAEPRDRRGAAFQRGAGTRAGRGLCRRRLVDRGIRRLC